MGEGGGGLSHPTLATFQTDDGPAVETLISSVSLVLPRGLSLLLIDYKFQFEH